MRLTVMITDEAVRDDLLDLALYRDVMPAVLAKELIALGLAGCQSELAKAREKAHQGAQA